MKKIILFLFLSFTFYFSNAAIIICRSYPENDCNGNFSSCRNEDYNWVTGDWTITITCTCSAFCGVYPQYSIGGGGDHDRDPTDITAAEYLFGLADGAIAQSTSSGSVSANYQADGENFVRHYTASWLLNVVTHTYEMSLDRDDY